MLHREVAVPDWIFRSVLTAVAVVGCLAASTAALPSPITYTLFAVTDVRLGNHHFRNAQVHLRFIGDTNDIRAFSVTAPDGNFATGYEITRGEASLVIISGKKQVKAHFLPNQLFVSTDTKNGGDGFGSLIGPNHLEPAYPLALADGGDVVNDLVTPGSFHGHAWSCVGFPPSANGGHCTDPAALPLKTDQGDFFIEQPYNSFDVHGNFINNFGGSANVGIFSIIAGAVD
jgi:hypothetical protein